MKHSLLSAIAAAFICLFFFPVARAQENVTLATVYPSPYGSYEDLEVASEIIIYESGQTTNATLSSNESNLTIGGRGYYQLSFDDGTTTMPYSFLKPYDSVATRTCPGGYIAVNYFKSDKTAVDPSASLPATGYVICVRGNP